MCRLIWWAVLCVTFFEEEKFRSGYCCGRKRNPFSQEYAQQHNNHIVIYERFKTAAVDRKEGSWVDFATARREFYPIQGIADCGTRKYCGRSL